MQSRSYLLRGIILLTVFGLILNLPYFHLKEFQGEEGRRVLIAQEMMKTGDWIVPHEEGEIYLKKPPMFNWLLAVMFKLTGRTSEITARLVSIIFTILCAMLLSLFWLSVNKSGLWFILPGFIFFSFPDVMDKAVRAEIDITFTFFITSSILSWFYFHEIKKRHFLAWMVSISWLSVALLTKGLISIFFFYISIASYLFYKRRLYEFINLRHPGGFIVGIIPFILWFIPLIQRIDISEVFLAWINEMIVRKEPLKEGGFLRHLLEFPYLFIIAYLPWIGMVLVSPRSFNFLKRQTSEREEIYGNIMMFCILPVVIFLIIFWLIPGARVRYILPLSGLLALAISGAIMSSMETDRAKKFVLIIAIVVILSGLTIPFIKGRFEFSSMIPYTCGILLFAGGIYLLTLRDAKKRLVTILVLLVIARNAWASIYFPYHQKNMSYYRSAAERINMIVPSSAILYDYNLGNPHAVFYLKRDVRKIKDMKEIRKGDYILVRRGEQDIPCGWEEIATLKARKMTIDIFRVTKICL